MQITRSCWDVENHKKSGRKIWKEGDIFMCQWSHVKNINTSLTHVKNISRKNINTSNNATIPMC